MRFRIGVHLADVTLKPTARSTEMGSTSQLDSKVSPNRKALRCLTRSASPSKEKSPSGQALGPLTLRVGSAISIR